MFDIAINNAYVIDPANRINSNLNVGIKDGKIAEISLQQLRGKFEINEASYVTTPGFIDIHMHEDEYNSEEDSFSFCIADAMLKMGVTTMIGGNCGIGYRDPAEYLKAVDSKGYPANIGLLCPHEALRDRFGSFDRYEPVDEAVVGKMAQFLEEQLERGCLGLSIGVEYIPGISKMEMIKLAEVASRHGKLVTVHVRSDADRIIPSIMEIINLSQDTGAAIQISHIGSMGAYGNMAEVLSVFDYYRSKGTDIGMDCYPYNAYCTHIGSPVFDEGFSQKYNGDYSCLEIAEGEYKGQRCTEEIFNKVREEYPKTLVIGHVMKEKDVDLAISHPGVIVGSDGIYQNAQGHPRGAGSFPRLINEYVKKKKLITLHEAVEKMAWLPAKRLGLKGKGSIAVGADADITIFEYEKIEDCATFRNPLAPPKGIEYVIVNGKIALEQGTIVNRNLGKAI